MTFTPSAATTRLLTDKFSGTGNPLVNWSAVWNNAATTFTGIRFDVTDTASAAGSLLMDLRVGGNTVASINKSGFFVSPGGGLIVGGTNSQYTYQASALALLPSGQAKVLIQTNEFNISNLPISWTSNTTAQAVDLSIWRDAADTLAQRNGVNAQAFRIYNTFTDASNYERGFVRWNANVLQIGAEAAGTGLFRTVQVGSIADNRYFEASVGNHTALYSGGSRLTFNSYYLGIGVAAGAPDAGFSRTTAAVMRVCGSSGANAGALEFLEQAAPAAPAANSVRIYAEDNGSGKTRLMALFATGAAQQIAIEP
jgi:hypothetical protein